MQLSAWIKMKMILIFVVCLAMRWNTVILEQFKLPLKGILALLYEMRVSVRMIFILYEKQIEGSRLDVVRECVVSLCMHQIGEFSDDDGFHWSLPKFRWYNRSAIPFQQTSSVVCERKKNEEKIINLENSISNACMHSIRYPFCGPVYQIEKRNSLKVRTHILFRSQNIRGSRDRAHWFSCILCAHHRQYWSEGPAIDQPSTSQPNKKYRVYKSAVELLYIVWLISWECSRAFFGNLPLRARISGKDPHGVQSYRYTDII